MGMKKFKRKRESEASENVDELDLNYNTTEGIKTVLSFEEMEFKIELLRGIYQCAAMEKPSDIQQRAFVPIITGHDVIAQARSGTGKTSMIAIAACQLVDTTSSKVQCLILSPTRELAVQTEKFILKVGTFINVKAHGCIGGQSLNEDTRKLKGGVHIVSGTPGRVYDMISRGTLNTRAIKTLFLDEADEMLGQGFKEMIYDVYRLLPPAVQVVLTSATLDKKIWRTTRKIMVDPVQILVKPKNLSLEGIKQFYVPVEEEWKFDTLCDLYDNLIISQCIIFCNKRDKVDWLSKKLRESFFVVSSIHGGMPQKERDEIMKDFWACKSRLLITSDVLSRGVDVEQVSLVVNYDVPNEREIYLHRVGRTGRYGRKGAAISFVTPNDVIIMKRLRKFFQVSIPPLPANIVDLI